MKLVLTTATFLTIIATPALAQVYAHHNPHYRHGHYYERYHQPPDYGFGGYFRPFGGSYGGYYGGYFGSGNYFGSPYNPCGLGRSVLEGCRPYRGY